jgi:hypothetical protein
MAKRKKTGSAVATAEPKQTKDLDLDDVDALSDEELDALEDEDEEIEEEEEEDEEIAGVPDTPMPRRKARRAAAPAPQVSRREAPRPAPAPVQPRREPPVFAQSEPYAGEPYSFEEARRRMQQPPPPGAPPLVRAGISPDPRGTPGFGPYPVAPQQPTQAVAPPQQPQDFVFAPVAAREQEQRPMLEGKATRLYVEVHREQFRDEDGQLRKDEEGYLGSVENSHEWLDVIKRRYGGGHYKLVGLFEGKPFERKVKIAGPSHEPDEDEDYEPPMTRTPIHSPGPATPPWAQRTQGVTPPWGGPPRPPWAGPQGSTPPWGGPSGGPPRPPWAGPPHQGGRGGQPWGAPYPTPQRDEELEELKERIAEAERERDREREERRVERLRQENKEAELRFERAMEAQSQRIEMLANALKDAGKSNQGGAMDQMIQMMTIQMQQDKQRQEREQAERVARMEVESARRREDEKDREKSFNRRQSELDKQREAEREQARIAADRDREFWGKMFEYNGKDRQKPKDLIELLAAAQAMNPQKDPTEAMTGMMTAMAAMKEVFSDGGGAPSAAENIVGKVTDTVQGMAEAYMSSRQSEPRMVDPAQMHAAQMAAAQQRLAMPGPGAMPTNAQIRALSDYRNRQALIASEMEAQGEAARLAMLESADRAPTGEEWGVILQATMRAYVDEREPEDVVPDLHALIVQKLRVPKALELLEGATPMMIKLKLPSIKNDVSPANPHYENLVLFEQYLIEDEEGREWLGQLLASLSLHQEAVRETAYQNTPQAQAAYGAPAPGGWTGAGGYPAAPSPNYPAAPSPNYPQAPGNPAHPVMDYPQATHHTAEAPAGYPGGQQGWQQGGHPQQQAYAQQQQQPQQPMMWANTPWGPRLVPVPVDARVAAVDQQPDQWQPNAGAPPPEQVAYGQHDQAAYGQPAQDPSQTDPSRPPSGAS